MLEFDKRRIHTDDEGDVWWWERGKWLWACRETGCIQDGNSLGMEQHDAVPIAWIRGEGPDEQSDPVHHPAHYTSGGVECIDAIRAALDEEGFRAYCLGNVLKYIWRAGKKGDFQEDLEKAAVYLGWAKEGGDDA